ncbi:MAG TPA: peptidyl-prolyl cis-trans isomerase [Terriglobia bacterium]|nr:peptidyl-prolyl cis-trans isomerase [Terriglobia bacterium]
MRSKIQIIALLLVVSGSLGLAQTSPSHDAVTGAAPISAHATGTPLAKPVARINGSVLTGVDLLREMYAIFPYARQHNGAFPKAMEADIRRGALKMIEFEELVYQEALRRHMTVEPDRLNKANLQFRKQFDSDQRYQQFLQIEASGSSRVLLNKIRRSLLIEDLLNAEVTKKSIVTPAEVKASYEKNPARFESPESYALQTITVLPPKNPTPDRLKLVRDRAEGALRRAKATRTYEEFGMLAEKISEDDFRVMMGDHKAVDATQLPPPVLQAASRLQPGEVSGLIQVDQALTIVRLIAHSPAHKQNFIEVKDAIRQELQQRKVNSLRAGLDERLRKAAKIEEL